MDCYIVSTKHTRSDSKFITVWRPDNSGYAWPLPWAGKYNLDEVMADPGYYNSRRSTIAVPAEVLDAVAVKPEAGWIDGDVGPVVLNNADNWALILANQIATQRAAQAAQGGEA
ncbi:hypothetical protein [Comamonas testosteroni]|uniref:hypothetical protein n=1 Tax=Comamonas testosteroni TaxID=285 RepID=UPI0012D35767|nr:hypothetical protein [Comamonas testosteroni]